LGFLFLGVFLAGCAGIKTPEPGQILKEPLGQGSLRTGMTISQVISVYGEPDSKRTVSSNEWSRMREEWFYSGRYSALPVGAGYLKEDLYLYFDGDNLTNISRKPLGKRRLEDAENAEETIK